MLFINKTKMVDYRDYDVNIATFFDERVSQEIVDAQKSVFDYFGIPIIQNKYDSCGDATHGVRMKEYIDSLKCDIFISFDIDSIPLTKNALDILVGNLIENGGIVGVAQQSNHIYPLNHPYAAPSCLCFKLETYQEIAPETLAPTMMGDTAEELTWFAEAKDIPITLIMPTHSEEPMFQLGEIKNAYGVGTTYGNIFYHAFNITRHRTSIPNFIVRCNDVLSGGGIPENAKELDYMWNEDDGLYING